VSAAATCGPTRTVFVDRDGTINRKARDGDYVKSPDEFVFLPGAKEGLRLLIEQRFRIVIVTNQRGIALGRMTVRDLEAIHDHMHVELKAANVQVEAIYYCPHDLGQCSCRKPEVGMFLQAQREHPDLALRGSIVLGDSEADMEAAARLGLRSVLITGEAPIAPSAPVSYRAPSLLDAAGWITRLSADTTRHRVISTDTVSSRRPLPSAQSRIVSAAGHPEAARTRSVSDLTSPEPVKSDETLRGRI
jgi:D-glycero-D-manno-heptose 1,7-bisphosphate phosphatase